MTKSITAKSAESVKEFIPLATQEKWLDTQIELGTDKVVDISAKCNISRQSWYEWQKIPGFIEWYYAEYEKRLIHLRPRLDAIGLKFSEKGSYQHWKDMQRFAGRSEEHQPSVNISVPVFNVMSQNAKEQLEKLYEGSNSGND